MSSEREATLLHQVGVISDRIRTLRAQDAVEHATQIKALEAESRVNWDELRALRAGPVVIEQPSARGHYR